MKRKFLFWTLLVIGFLEIVIRFHKPNGVLRQELQINDRFHHPRPYVMAAADPQNTIGHNPLGYRGNLPELPKPANEFRVILLGGSTVQIGDPAPFSRLLNDLHLKHQNKEMRFYNFGVISSVSRQDLVRIMVDVSGYQPDLILHYGGGNDFIPVDPRINYPHRFVFYEKSLLFDLRNSWQGTLMFLVTRSALLKTLFRGPIEKYYFQDVNSQFTDHDNIAFYQVAAYWQNLSWMQHLATTQGFDYLAVFQPLLAFKTNLSDREKEIPTSETRDAILRKRDLFLKLIGSPKWMVRLEDCSNIFKDFGEEVFVDQIHVNAAGQKMAMQCIREKLEQHLNTKHASHALQSPITIPEHIFIIGQTDFKKWLQEFAQINF